MNAYQEITEKIIEKMQSGCIPWHQPWARILNKAVKHSNGTPYSVLNQMLLGGVPGEYITFNQTEKEGGHVKKGAKSSRIYLWKHSDKKKKEEDMKDADDADEKKIREEDGFWFLKRYNVFNIEDTEGVTPKWYDKAPDTPAENVKSAELVLADYICRNDGLSIVDADRADYDEESDKVLMPDIIRFRSKELYYKTLFHQIAHSTAREERLARSADSAAFTKDYDEREDLLAEICSAMVCSFAGLDIEKTVEDTAAYVDRWIPVLRHNPRMIVWATRRAEEAARFILNDMAA